MIQKNPFLKYVIKDTKEDVFHSSAYAKAQNGAAMGAASTESYQQRIDISQNRQVVRGYNESKIMQGTALNRPKAKVYTPPEKPMGGAGLGGTGSNGARPGGAGSGGARPGGVRPCAGR